VSIKFSDNVEIQTTKKQDVAFMRSQRRVLHYLTRLSLTAGK